MMTRPMIRFTCACGKRLATPVKFAGRQAQCPKCKKTLRVPRPKRPAAPPSPPATEPVTSCSHPKLDSFYRVLLKKFADRIDRHEVVDGAPTLRFLIPEERHQAIRLVVEKDDKDREWLLIQSEIGTVTTFDETATALKLNHSMHSGRLYLDDFQILQLEHRARLDEVDEAEVVAEVAEVAHEADVFEADLFGIDVR